MQYQILALILSFAYIHTTNAAPQSAPKTNSKSIHILSYNVKGLPDIAGGYNNKRRLNRIAELLVDRRQKLSEPHLVLVQEAFIKEAKSIVKKSGYPFYAFGPSKTDFDENQDEIKRTFDSGLVILSNYKIINSHKMPFAKKDCKSWDCYSNKGVQMVEVEIPGIPFSLHIANTHLQAHDKHEKVRLRQLDTLHRFFNSNLHSHSAFILTGDFNCLPHLECYTHWKKLMQLTNVGEYCLSPDAECHIPPSTDKEMVHDKAKDQHHVRNEVMVGANGELYQVDIKPVFLERNFTEIFEGKPLSDHLGYEVTYDISWSKVSTELAVK